MDVCRSDGKFVLKLDGPTSPTPPSPPLACQLPSQHYISLLKVFLPRLQHPPSVVSLLVHQKIGLTILAGTVAVINHFHSQLCIYLCWHRPRLYWHNWHRHHHHVYHVRAGHSTPGQHQPRQAEVCDGPGPRDGAVHGDNKPQSVLSGRCDVTTEWRPLDWDTSPLNKNIQHQENNRHHPTPHQSVA